MHNAKLFFSTFFGGTFVFVIRVANFLAEYFEDRYSGCSGKLQYTYSKFLQYFSKVLKRVLQSSPECTIDFQSDPGSFQVLQSDPSGSKVRQNSLIILVMLEILVMLVMLVMLVILVMLVFLVILAFLENLWCFSNTIFVILTTATGTFFET